MKQLLPKNLSDTLPTALTENVQKAVTDSLQSYRDALQKESTHVKQSTDLQFVINGVPENESSYLKQLDAHSKVVDEAVQHIGLHPSGNLSSVRCLGKRLNPESNQPRKYCPLLITSNNSQFMNNCFARSHHLQDFRLPIYVKKLISADERKLKKEILSTRYNLIQNKGYDCSLFRIRKLELFYNNQPIGVEVPTKHELNCLLVNALSLLSVSKRHELTKLCSLNTISLLFITET